jgi:hypothetical protein
MKHHEAQENRMAAYDSFFLNQATAAEAVEMCLPMIRSAMDSGAVGESGFLYLVVMNPGRTPADSRFEDAILYEHSVGDREKWDADYGEFARAKARVAWKAGMDAHQVQELKPWLLAAGDTVLWGSVALDGIVVAASGAHAWFDEAFAGAVAMCLKALAKRDAAAARQQGLFLAAR